MKNIFIFFTAFIFASIIHATNSDQSPRYALEAIAQKNVGIRNENTQNVIATPRAVAMLATQLQNMTVTPTARQAATTAVREERRQRISRLTFETVNQPTFWGAVVGFFNERNNN
jgi:mannose/fructose/N-acetylgalactosamine-specific phosphotransferase system component IIC